jgi:hypothetical protein
MTLGKLYNYIDNLVKSRLYGKLEITFEKGIIVHIRKIQDIKL